MKLIRYLNNKYVKAEGPINPKGQVASRAQKQRHKQILTKAIQALDQQSVEKREFQSITMCIDPALLPEAKKRIQEFADKFQLAGYYVAAAGRCRIFAEALQAKYIRQACAATAI